jgi:hypothetical protein
MNPLQPVKVFIPVDINDEIPIGEYKDAKFIDDHHWLKEQSLFVFDKESLEKLLGDAFDAGANHEFYGRKHPDKSQYINSLLK